MRGTYYRIGWVALGAAMLLAGCAPKLTWTPSQPSPRPMAKRAVGSVEVYNDKAPPRPFVEVGVIRGDKKRSSTQDVRGKLTQEMQKKAAQLGCDAIFVRDISQPEIADSKKQPPLSLEAGCLMWSDQAPPPGVAQPGYPPTPPPGAPPPAADAPPPPVGCANDMQCKGNRICENGQCVSPPAPTTGETEADAGTSTASGKKCDMDTDCPGNEICQNHKCVSGK